MADDQLATPFRTVEQFPLFEFSLQMFHRWLGVFVWTIIKISVLSVRAARRRKRHCPLFPGSAMCLSPQPLKTAAELHKHGRPSRQVRGSTLVAAAVTTLSIFLHLTSTNNHRRRLLC